VSPSVALERGVEVGRKPRPGLKLGQRVRSPAEELVEVGRKPRPGLKLLLAAAHEAAALVSK